MVELPNAIWEWIEQSLPSVSREVRSATSGFADGIRGRIDAPSSSVFLKARLATDVGAADDALEASVLSSLPTSVGAPRLIASGEVAGWFAELMEFIEGTTPTEPWDTAVLADAIAHIDRMQPDLRAVRDRIRLPTLNDRMRGRADTWWQLSSSGQSSSLTIADLTDWEIEHLDRLTTAEQSAPAHLEGEDIVHFDVRHDNILIEPNGRIRLLDWGRACIGPAWADVACLLLESTNLHPRLDPVFRTSLTASAAPDAAVDALLVVLLSYWRQAAATSTDGGTRMQRRRQASMEATRTWLIERWG